MDRMAGDWPTISRVTGPVVVILAAGEGTRMRSATPKLLHPICGRPMIGWPVAAAREAGASKIVVVDGPKRRLEPELGASAAGGDGNGAGPNGGATEVVLTIQEQPRGTADAVSAAAGAFAGADTVIVIYGDVPLIAPGTLRALADAHAADGAAATMATVVVEDPAGYGRVVRDSDGSVLRVVETKTPGDATEAELAIREINTGIYAFDAQALTAALAQVGADNAQGEFYLPDVLPIMRADGLRVGGWEMRDESQLLGINDRVGLAQVRAAAQRAILEAHMRAGVTIVDPACTVIDVGVQIGADAVIAPFTSLHGATVIGADARIGPLTTMTDCEVGPGASVVHSYAQGASIGERVTVGPFAYLRPGAVLREGAKAGTFVEIKNSDVGPGAKVPHLSYIGDTDIGAKTNIGAGTITANYDGVNKSRTTIGAGAFVSVDTMLVAPVSVGDGAYTAAGSVITKDVPPGALGVARARQENIDHYAERRAARRQAAGSQPAPGPEGESPSGRT